jgi:4-amino-4-deoxy-L-arabinose transferase-like glycosyltransferase
MNTHQKTKWFHWLILSAILAAAFAVRIWNIEGAPAGVYPDEAVNGIDAIKVNLGEQPFQWFYTDNNGREGLFMNLVALSFQIFGVSVLGLKIPSIIFGTLTVLGVFLVTKEIFRTPRAGLFAAYLIAFSFWSINFSRISFRAIMVPFILTFSFYFLLRAIRTKSFWQFAVSGFIFGIGFHTYIAFRIAPAIIIIAFLGLLITKKHLFHNYWKQAAIFMIFMLISAAPIIWTFYTHPEFLESRSASISILSPEVNQGHLLKIAARSFGLSLVKYNFWGDQNWRHNYPPYPILNPIVGVSFLIGLIYLIAKFFHLLWLRIRHDVRDQKLFTYAFLLVWFFSMLAPEFLTAEGNPHALRSIGTLPVVFIIATIPILWILGKTDTFSQASKTFFFSFIISLLAFVGIFDIVKYHYFWANNPIQYQSFESNLMLMANFIKELPAEKNKVVIAENMQRIPIKLFNYQAQNIYYVYPGEIQTFLDGKTLNNPIFILTNKNDSVIEILKKQYPLSQLKGISTDEAMRFNTKFCIFK